MYDFYRDLIAKNDSKIVLMVLDGLGGLPREAGGKTELATARTPGLSIPPGLRQQTSKAAD